MLDARARTKARGNIQKRAVGAAGEWGLTNRMPYFFACLKGILELNEDASSFQGNHGHRL